MSLAILRCSAFVCLTTLLAAGCLPFGESGGMGEGIGDAIATIVRTHAINETEFSMGEWASSRIGGIRNYKYSTNMVRSFPNIYLLSSSMCLPVPSPSSKSGFRLR